MTDRLTPTLRRFFCLALALAGAAALPAVAEPCDPEAAQWIPSRYYPAGTVVYHLGEWFESRELHQGLEPGITFEWIELDSAPDCGRAEAASDAGDGKQDKGDSGNPDPDAPAKVAQPKAGPSERGVDASGKCVRPDHWQFSRSYTVGSLTTHGGQIWEAIRPTNGDMPGMTEPPHWRLVQEHCSLQAR